MKKHLTSLSFPPVDPSVEGHHQHGGVERLMLLPYKEVIEYLLHNSKLPGNSSEKHAEASIEGYKVVLNSLKLRTFAHFYEQGQPCCSNGDCGLTPAYFVLERTKNNKLRARKGGNAAYLSLYGLDERGHEVEFTHDHTLARCFGGANALANTTVMCKKCNNQKSRIESRMHHRTLKVLREFLEEKTGQKADPHFLLERVRKAEYNLSTVSMQYERVGEVSLGEVIDTIRNPNVVYKQWHDKKVKVNGVRLNAFAKHDIPCCQDPDCQMTATHFAIERVAGKELNDERGYHLNMYGRNHKGDEVQFSHHQVLCMGEDGSPEQLQVITMCNECKEKNLDIDNSVMANKINSFGGVTRMEWEEDQNKKQNKVLKIANILQEKFGFENLAQLVAWCNEQGRISNVKTKRARVQNIIDAVDGLTTDGARWFKHQHNNIFVEKKSIPNQLTDEQLQEKLHHKIGSGPKSRKFKRYCIALARFHHIDEESFVPWLEQQALEKDINNDWNDSMNSVSNVMNALRCSARAARLFHKMCGKILDVGPKAKTPGNDPHYLNQVLVSIEDNRKNEPSERRNKKLDKCWTKLDALIEERRHKTTQARSSQQAAKNKP